MLSFSLTYFTRNNVRMSQTLEIITTIKQITRLKLMIVLVNIHQSIINALSIFMHVKIFLPQYLTAQWIKDET